ncbi:hypothetical protein ACTA71_007833 [Dictyostelium dimigraforme]
MSANNLFSYERYSKPSELDNDDYEDYSDDSDSNDYLENDSFSVNKGNNKNNNGSGGGISKPKKNSTKQQQQQTLETTQLSLENISTVKTTEKSLKTNKKHYNDDDELCETIEEINKTKKLTKSEVQSIIDDEIENKKKERLPSSEEVYNRILYDDILKDKSEDIIILYEDRFDGLKKATFKSFEFGIVPLHRIKQFSYLDKIFWDRKERIYDFSIFDTTINNIK